MGCGENLRYHPVVQKYIQDVLAGGYTPEDLRRYDSAFYDAYYLTDDLDRLMIVPTELLPLHEISLPLVEKAVEMKDSYSTDYLDFVLDAIDEALNVLEEQTGE